MAKKEKSKGVKRKKLVCGKPKERIHPEDSEWYPAEFDEWETKDGNYGVNLILKFKITEGELEDGSDAEGALINYWGQADFHHGDKTYDALCVLMDEEIDIDDEVDLDSVLGKTVEVLTKVEKKSDGKTFSKVAKIRLPKKAKKKKKAAPAKTKTTKKKSKK